MTNEDIDRTKLRLDEERLELEKARLQLESSFSKKYFVPLLSILGAIVVGVFALAQVLIASIQKTQEIEVARLQKDRELSLAASEQERRWKLDTAEFIFNNRAVIFSSDQNAEQQRITKVIAVTFPPDIAGVLFENVKATAPSEQKPLWEEGQLLVEGIRQRRVEATQTQKAPQEELQRPERTQQISQGRLYYVIAMTSSSHEDIEGEINRVRRRFGNSFDTEFPDIEVYVPDGGGAYTLLISGKSLPYEQANKLKQRAIEAGFSKDTWLWQSSVWYFSSKKD